MQGGIRVAARLDLGNFLRNAEFRFDVEFFPTSLSSLILPNFVATASIDEANLGGGRVDCRRC